MRQQQRYEAQRVRRQLNDEKNRLRNIQKEAVHGFVSSRVSRTYLLGSYQKCKAVPLKEIVCVGVVAIFPCKLCVSPLVSRDLGVLA